MRWTFGEPALGQQQELALRLRRLTSLALALEQESPALDRLLGELDRAEAALAGEVPADPSPRVGPMADGEGRVYVDHGHAIGAFNACFPEYELTVVDEAAAHGTVTFPIAYEGPPGLVHGGFLALFFDCVVQDHNCEVNQAGKTTSMALRYRRPTPLITPLSFTLERSVADDRIHSVGRLLLGDRVTCEAGVDAVAGTRTNLPAASPRRTPS